MLLYFASEKNADIFNNAINELGINLTLEKEDFLNYAKKNTNKLSYIDFLAIDLEYVLEDDNDILESIKTLKMFNKSIEIIIVAFGKEKGDYFLGKLFANGIYNFITANDELEREKEIMLCLEKRNDYSTAFGYQIDFDDNNEEKPKKNIFRNFIENIKLKEKKEKKQKGLNKSNKTKTVEYETKESYNNFEETKNNFNNNNIHYNNHSQRYEEFNNDFTPKNNYIREDNNYIREDNYDENINLDKRIDNIFGNINFSNIKEDEKNKSNINIYLESISENNSFLTYYRKRIGLYNKVNNYCIVDTLFEKDDIIKYLELAEIKFNFKDGVIEEIKTLL